ncbi:DUF5970 family protein [Bacillus sp. Bos-x628]
MKSTNYLLGVPVILAMGCLVSMSHDFLFPVLTFGLVGLYLFIFSSVQNKWVNYFFLLIFVLNLLASIALYFDKQS